MEHIFNSLELIDLFNVSELSGIMMTAAQLVYSKRYSSHLLKICGMEKSSLIEIEELVISISSIEICSKFLKVFGDSIKKLQLEYFTNDQLSGDWIEVKKLIHEKCAKHLIELKLVNCQEELFGGAQNALENVKSLRISCSQLGQCIELDKWFPSIEQLELMHNDGCIQIVSYFPFLCFLAMDTCLKMAEIEIMLKSAPQLQTLLLHGGIDASLLQFISETLPNLKQLRLWGFHLATKQEDVIHFKSIEALHIATGFLGILPTDIPFEFECLKELRLIADSFENDWIDFVLQQHQLEKLTLDTTWQPEISDDHLAKISSTLTQLKEFDVVANVTAEGLIKFLNGSKSMQKIRITKYDGIKLAKLDKSIHFNWHVSYDRRSVTFERKSK